jgi:RHS repeat-associated protein
MKNNKKTGQLFYKLVTAILLSTFLLSPLSVAFADDAPAAAPSTENADSGTSSSDTLSTPAASSPDSQQSVSTPDNSTADTTAKVAIVRPSNNTELNTSLAKHDADVNSALSYVTPDGQANPNVQHPMTLSSTAPTQQADSPQPSGLSRTNLVPNVDSTTGALQYSYPLTLAPGRNGMTPSLSLQYNSQNTASDSIMGYGWNVSVPYIQREAKHGADNLYTGTYNDFTSDKGEIAQISGTTYGLRSDDGSLSKYTFSSNTWSVTTKAGLIYLYGTTAASRQDDATTPTNVYKWMLDKITDANGNSISYSYFKDQGQIYVDTVTYTNTAGGSGTFTVTFGREVATNSIPNGYATGFSVITKYRINAITMAVSGTTRHQYALAYVLSDNQTRSLLSTITETGYSPTGSGKTFPPTKLTYTNSGGKVFTKNTSWTLPTHTLTGGFRQDSRLGLSGDKDAVWPNAKDGILIDVNGDGLPDWVETEDPGFAVDTSTTFGSTNGHFYDVWLGTSSGFVLSTSWTSALPTDSTGKQYELNNQLGGPNIITDVNGDGLPDFIITTQSSTLNGDTDVVWLNTGTGWAKTTTWTMPTMVTAGTTYGIQLGYSNGVTGVSGYTYNTNILDINNDGLPDIVQTTGDNFGASTTSDHYSVWLNTGTGWSKSTTWGMPVHPTGSGTYYGSSTNSLWTDTIVDINGDGLPDWIETTYSPTSNETYDVWLNTGASWVRSTTWALPVHTGYTLPANTNTSLGVQLGFSQIICNYGIGGSYVCGTRSDTIADINGDGLADIVETTDYLTEFQVVWLNNGKNGWVKTTSWAMPTFLNTSGFSGTPPLRLGNNGGYSTQLSDVNNDGLPDFVASCDCGTTGSSANPQFQQLYLNTGQGWASSSWTQPVRTGSVYNGSILGFTQFSGTYIPMQFRGTILQDVNGDGSPDWVESNQFQTPVTYALGGDANERYFVWLNSATQADLLASVTSDHGASATYTYAPQVIVDKNPTIQTQTVEVVSSVTNSDGNGVSGTTSYSYSNGKYFFSSLVWKKFAGFQKVTTTNPDGSKVINYFHQGNGIDTATYEYSDAESEIGKLYRTDVADGSGNLYTRTTTELVSTPITSVNSNVAFVHPSQRITETFDGNATERATAETWAYNTTTGTLTTYTNFGEVTATTPIAYTDIGTDKSVTSYTYASNVAGMYAVSDESTVDQSAVKVRETRHYYDAAALGTITLGNETKTEQWKVGSTYVNTQKAYNSYGLPTTSTDERGKVTTYTTYDANNLYPITVTDPLSHTTNYTYDYMFGLVIQTTDPNGQIYIKNYDGMGRILNEQIPDPASGTTVYRASYGYDDEQVGVSNVEAFMYTDSGTQYYVERYYDGLGRLIEMKRQTDPNNTWYDYQNKDYYYNNMGKLSKQTLACMDYAGWYNRGACGSTLEISYTYDPVGRVLTTVNNLGSTVNAYDDWKTTVTDPKTNVKKYYADAYGNLVKVDEINGGSTYTTNYVWNLNKNLTKVTDALSNVRNFTYDGLGRRLTAQDLHASADATFGSWSYTYDDAGNMTQSISPKSATVNYTYDDVNRKLTEDYTGAAGTEITNTYDTCTQGVGRLCTVTMTSGANSTYTYDYNGNIKSENKTINGSSFLTSYTYNRGGDIVTLTYPDSAVVQYSYISDGLLSSVNRMESGGSFVAVINSVTYSPDLRLATIHYTNAVTTTNTYDSSKLYRLTNKVSLDGSSNHIQDYAYTYDLNGNITNIVNTSGNDTGETVVYTYDPLNRIKTATASSSISGNNYAETYSYDALGNITAKNGQTYLYQGNTGTLTANPDAATSVNAVTYTYDADGNLTTNGTITNTWNYKDQLTQTVKGAVTVNYYYDQNGNRVWYKVGSANTYYPNSYYSYDGTTKTKQIYIGNLLVATIKTAGGTVTPWYVQSDNILGSNLVTSSGGIQQQVLAYYPYGDIRLNEIFSTIDEKNKFGSHLYDSETDLNYFGARYYNAKIGRFISEDPSFLSIGDNNLVQQNAKQSQTNLLMNPQAFNSYTYANNNPITNIDPDGKIAGVDDAIGFGVGAFVGSLTTVGSSLLSNGRLPSGSEIAGGALTGGIIGWGAINTPETLGASNVVSASIVTGLIGGFYGNVTTQSIDMLSGKQPGGLNYKDAQLAGLSGAAVGSLTGVSRLDLKIPGLSSGTGNAKSIFQGLQTKAASGTISNISANTVFKAALGSQASDGYRTLIGTGVDALRSFLNKK